MKVYVGYDTREDIAYQVCEHSIKRRNGKTEVQALKQSDSAAKTRLLNVLGKCEEATEEMIQDGVAALQELGSIDYAREKANEYHQHAHACLDRLPDGPAMIALRELTDLQLKRLS